MSIVIKIATPNNIRTFEDDNLLIDLLGINNGVGKSVAVNSPAKLASFTTFQTHLHDTIGVETLRVKNS